jgi:hypothetical protein
VNLLGIGWRLVCPIAGPACRPTTEGITQDEAQTKSAKIDKCEHWRERVLSWRRKFR